MVWSFSSAVHGSAASPRELTPRALETSPSVLGCRALCPFCSRGARPRGVPRLAPGPRARGRMAGPELGQVLWPHVNTRRWDACGWAGPRPSSPSRQRRSAAVTLAPCTGNPLQRLPSTLRSSSNTFCSRLYESHDAFSAPFHVASSPVLGPGHPPSTQPQSMLSLPPDTSHSAATPQAAQSSSWLLCPPTPVSPGPPSV